jgi:hypothetical protein
MGSLTSYNTCLASCKRGLRWLPGRHDAEARIVAYSEYERYDEDIVDPQESRQRGKVTAFQIASCLPVDGN